MTMLELQGAMSSGHLSSVKATQAYLDRIGQVDGQVGAYLTVTSEKALAMAEQADKLRAEGKVLGPLHGVPLALKDNLCTEGVRTTCASKMLENFVPPYSATVVKMLESAGAVFLGKTNMDEFAMGSSSENSALGRTVNPWNLECIPGGSSGGSAAAVAADVCAGALGSDTGGSIRQPAAVCGVVGLKPTYGRVSRYGLVAFASSLDQIGPLTKDVSDAAALLQATAGHDDYDSTSANLPVPDYMASLKRGVEGLRVGMPKEFFAEGVGDPDTRTRVEESLATLERLGAKLVEVELPTSPYAIGAYYLCATAEASSNLARYDGAHYGLRVEADNVIDMFSRTRAAGFGKEVKRRIMLGTYALSAGYYDAFYLKALRVRTLIAQDFARAFEKCDVIAGPTTPTPAFRLGEKTSDPLEMYLSDIFTVSVNLAGIAGLSLPCGVTGAGLPVGLQLIGPAFGEEVLLSTGYALEQALAFRKSHQPALVSS
jgi:aspartyl-tRNA(Asn)/glutamyl-tRNA(Gln) amidotransferase subunit A